MSLSSHAALETNTLCTMSMKYQALLFPYIVKARDFFISGVFVLEYIESIDLHKAISVHCVRRVLGRHFESIKHCSD